MTASVPDRGNVPPRSVVLLGFGALARFVIRHIEGDAAIRISHVLVRPERLSSIRSALPPRTSAITSLDDLKARPDLILELASHAAVATIVPQALEAGLRVAIASTGALADDRLREHLIGCATRGGTQLQLLPGAVGALDALFAHREASLEDVVYTGTKIPTAWRNTPAAKDFDLERIRSPVIIFEGVARDAAALYPQNANVAATLAIAGIGFDRTRVRLIADPSASKTSHRIEATSSAGRLFVEMASEPLAENLKTSRLTAYSAVRMLRNLVEPFCL
jgi:aspartate dehydrogenase